MTGILAAPVLYASTALGPDLLLKGFAAAAVGWIGNNRGALIAGYIIGITEAVGASLLSPGYQETVIFIVVLTVLLLRPQGLFGESKRADGLTMPWRAAVRLRFRPPYSPSRWHCPLSSAPIPMRCSSRPSSASISSPRSASTFCPAMRGRSRLATARFRRHRRLFGRPAHGRPSLVFWAAAVVGMGLAAGLGVLAALPAFRLNTWYFAFITLAFALVFEKMIVEWRWLTKGFAGVVGVPPPSAFGFEFGPRPLYYTIVLAIVAFVIVRNIIEFALRPFFVRVRDVEPAALAVGASPQRTKLIAFVISAALAGIAGAFFAVQKTVVTPDDFTADFSIFFLLTIVLGGLGTLWGPIIGALVFFLIPELLAGMQAGAC